MKKPISVQVNELSNAIIEVINESELHPLFLEPIIREIYNLVLENAKRINELEINEYKKSLETITSEANEYSQKEVQHDTE